MEEGRCQSVNKTGGGERAGAGGKFLKMTETKILCGETVQGSSSWASGFKEAFHMSPDVTLLEQDGDVNRDIKELLK